MVSDKQVKRLMKLIQRNKPLAVAAAKADMDEKTARKYVRLERLPSEMKVPHRWRTRPDPYAEVWQEVREQLEAKASRLERECLKRYSKDMRLPRRKKRQKFWMSS